jgi:DNA polymerase V
MKVSEIIRLDKKYDFEAPVFKASTGLKKSIETYIKTEKIDLNKLLIPKPDNYFLVKVNGNSMIGSKILDGDILVVDRNQKPKENCIVVSSLNGELTVKTFKIIDDKGYLVSSNEKFLPIEISEFYKFEIQGVVKHIIRATE